jgi:inner membrane transporter RhtA
MTRRKTRGAPTGPALLVVAAATIQEVGAAFAVGLFTALGAVGAVFIRFAVAGVILWVAVRPRLRGLARRAWGTVAMLACALTVMNLCFYQALARIPLGIAVTIEVCGPLILSVVLGHRRVAWLWALLAFAGVAMLGIPADQSGGADAVGFAFAAGAAVSWAGYIVASARAASEFPKLDALAMATLIGALATAPLAAFSINLDAALHWHVLAMGVAVGLMSSVIPYSLELVSLRTLPPATFAVLTCLSPVIAALAGWVVLHQQLKWTDYLAIVLVTTASIGAVRSAQRRAPRDPSTLIAPSDVVATTKKEQYE